MKIAFTRRHTIVLIVCVLVVIGIVFGLRYLYVVPTMNEMKTAEMELQSEKEILAALQEQIGGEKTVDELTSLNLQRKVPVEPLIDALLLDLSRAEVMSNSYILNITFEDIEVTSKEDIVGQNDEEENADREESDDDESTENEDEPFHFEGLRKIVANVQLSALNFEELAKFLETVDRLPRLVMIESVQFADDTGELITVDDEVYELYFDVRLATYYYPDLKDLKEELPIIDYPNPANKNDPLYNN